MTPALTHEDANAQLLDLVYGEAEGTTREALEAHVAGCAQCKADLAALGDTHQLLRGSFEDLPVPARVHARILESAKAGAVTVESPKARVPSRVPASEPATPSFWERMRGRWTLPTLATVGAVAVVVITSRMFLDPNRAFEQMQERRAPAQAEPPPPASPAPAEELAAGAPAAAPADDREGEPRPNAELLQRRRKALEQLRLNPPGGRGALRTRSMDDRLRSALERLDAPALGSGGGGVASGGGALGGIAASRDDLAKVGAKAPEAEKADKAAAKPAAAPARSGAYASPPAGWAHDGKATNTAKKGEAVAPAAPAPPPAPASAPMAAAPAKRKAQSQRLEELEGSSAASAAGPSAQPSEPMREMDESSNVRAKSVADSERKERQKDAAPSVDTLARKAGELFAAGRWNEAIAAYRDLLRRFPDADPVPQWRSRLLQAERQETARRAAKAAPAAQ
jgi:hypothetical protein